MRTVVATIGLGLKPASILHHPSCFLLFPSTPKYLGIAANWITTAVVSVPNSGLYLVNIMADPAGEICFKNGRRATEVITIQKV